MILAYWNRKSTMLIYLKNCKLYLNDNKIQVNIAKTTKIVFHRPNAKNVSYLSELPRIERVSLAKWLDVWLQADMCIRKHMLITFCTFVSMHVFIYTIEKASITTGAVTKCFWCYNSWSCSACIKCLERIFEYSRYWLFATVIDKRKAMTNRLR